MNNRTENNDLSVTSDEYQINSADQHTQVTSDLTVQILNEILENIEAINFRIKKHSEQEQIERKLAEIEDRPTDDQEAKNIADTIESMLKGINITQRDYKIFSTIEILRKAKEIGNPLASRNGIIYIYNGKYWDDYDPADFIKFLEKCYLNLGVPKTLALDAGFHKKGLEQFEDTALTKDNNEKTTYLNFQNGTMWLDESGGFTLKEHDPSDFIRYVLPYEYDQDAECPEFQDYLDFVVPQEDKQLVLAEFIGSVFSSLKHEKVLILFGDGRNGKSVFLDVITALLGSENICSHTLESLSDSKLYYLGDLAKALLNYSSEISTKVNPDTFKKLASGEKVTARYPYGKPFEVDDYARLAFNCNQLPEAKEYTKGFFRRFLIIPFEKYIPDNKVEKRLAEKIIAEELPGIMNWVLDGLLRLEEQVEFTDCESSERVLEIYKREADTVKEFLYHYEGKFDQAKKSSALYDLYNRFCIDFGLKKLGVKQFAQDLRKKGIIYQRRSDGMYYHIHQYDLEM